MDHTTLHCSLYDHGPSSLLSNYIVLHILPLSHNTHTNMIVRSFSSSPRLLISSHAYHLDHLFLPISSQHAHHQQPPLTHDYNDIRSQQQHTKSTTTYEANNRTKINVSPTLAAPTSPLSTTTTISVIDIAPSLF